MAARARSFQCGAPRPAKAGTTHHAAVGFDRFGKRGELRDVLETEKGGHPRRGLGGDGDVAFERVGGAVAAPPSDGRRQAALATHRRLGHRHQRGAGAIGGLHLARLADGVAEERGVGIAHHGVDGHARRQTAGTGGHAEARVGAHRRRQDGGTARQTGRTSSASHAPAAMLKSWVREALPKSVAWTAPPVRLNSSQESTVPAHNCPAAARSRAAGYSSRSQPILAAGNIGLSARPVFSATSVSTAGLRRRSMRSAERRHCHDTQGPIGVPRLPVPEQDRFALVGDADGGDLGASPGLPGSRQWPRPACPKGPPATARPSPAAGS